MIASEIESEIGVKGLFNQLLFGGCEVLVGGLVIGVGIRIDSLLVLAPPKRNIKCIFSVRLDSVGWSGEVSILNLQVSHCVINLGRDLVSFILVNRWLDLVSCSLRLFRLFGFLLLLRSSFGLFCHLLLLRYFHFFLYYDLSFSIHAA